MSERQGFSFELIHTGVPNLDTILGGGLPVGSFNLIAGGPGTGKTILSQQIMFYNAALDLQILHFTVLGESVAKLLRYQSRMSFFDPSKVNLAIRFIDIGDIIRKEGLERGLDVIVSRVERYSPDIVIIDSVRAVREITRREGEYGLRSFTHDLAQVAIVWNVTSFMVGEYEESDLKAGPEFTMADGIIWMVMEQAGNSVVRKLQVIKSRGMNPIQGLHSFKISKAGIYVYPRIPPPTERPRAERGRRAPFGVPGLDRMMSGGIPENESCLIAGASGTGKSILAYHFITEGVRRGEPCILMTFEDSPSEIASRAMAFGWDFAQWERDGKLSMIYRAPMDLTIDEVIDQARKEVERLDAKRLVIDSLSGFELARSPADQSNFRESLQRLVAWLTSRGLTVVMTTEIPEVFGELRFSTYEISFIADNIILLRYVEIESELRKVLAVVKMRGSSHDKELRHWVISEKGAIVGAPLREYTGLLSGSPTLVSILGPQPFAPGLEAKESALVQALFGLGTATARQLASEVGFAEEDVEKILQGLVGMGYVVKEKVDDEPAYHVSMVSWAPTTQRLRPEKRRRGGGERHG